MGRSAQSRRRTAKTRRRTAADRAKENRQIRVVLTPSTHDELRERTSELGMAMSAYARTAIRRQLKRDRDDRADRAIL